jgi:hypothetical protein
MKDVVDFWKRMLNNRFCMAAALMEWGACMVAPNDG